MRLSASGNACEIRILSSVSRHGRIAAVDIDLERMGRLYLAAVDSDPSLDCRSCAIRRMRLCFTFSRQVWQQKLTNFSLKVICPQPTDAFADWFKTAADRACAEKLKEARSLVILTVWCLWNLRNDFIFQHCEPKLLLFV